MSAARIVPVAGAKRKAPCAADSKVSLAALLRRADASPATPIDTLDDRARAAHQAARGDFLYVWAQAGPSLGVLAVHADSDAAALVHALLDRLHRDNVMSVHLRRDEALRARVRLFRMVRHAARADDGPRVASAALSAQALLDATRAAGDDDDSAGDAAHAVFVERWIVPVRDAFRRVALPSIGAATPAYRVRVVQ
jgi:hypothetical protein